MFNYRVFNVLMAKLEELSLINLRKIQFISVE